MVVKEFKFYARGLLTTDLNEDGKVDILDIVIIGRAYGSYPGHPRWNAIADLDKNEVINIKDILPVARDYGLGCIS